MDILNILKSKGINYEDLKEDERQIYSQWEKMLKDEISVEKIRDFLKIQLNAVEMEICQPDLSDNKTTFLKAELRIFKTLSALIEAPKHSEEWLKNYLDSILPKIKTNG